MSKKILKLVCVLSLFMLSGCWDLREINASSIPTGVGIELQDDQKIRFSAQLIQPLPPSDSGTGEMETVVISASDYGVAAAARRLSLSLSKVPEWAHLKTFILGEKLSRSDLSLAIDFMTRNRNIRPDMNLVVASHTSPQELLSSKLLQVYDLGSGLNDLLTLNENQLGIYVPITMGEFTYKLTTPGIEPAVPQITLTSMGNASKTPEKPGDNNGSNTDNKKNEILLNGMAVFKGRKMAGSFNENESRGYRWLNSTSKTGGLFNIASPLNNQEYIALDIIRFSSKAIPQLNGNRLKMLIEIHAELGFYEQNSAADLLSLEMKEPLEAAASREIKRQVAACINKSQHLESDVLGWGRILQEQEPDKWKEVAADWSEQFPLIDSDIRVKCNLKRNLLSIKSFKFQ